MNINVAFDYCPGIERKKTIKTKIYLIEDTPI
jgi:hypothetical protein